MITDDGDEGVMEDGNVVMEIEGEPYAMAEVSLNSVVGLSNPRTMKLKGKVGNREVFILIDSGATNNFISNTTVERLELSVTEKGKFGVTLGNGGTIWGRGECKEVHLTLQGTQMVEDFLILELGNIDIILGLQWLEKLGEIVVNWKTQIMRFQWESKKVELKGDLSLEKSQLSLKAMGRTLLKER